MPATLADSHKKAAIPLVTRTVHSVKRKLLLSSPPRPVLTSSPNCRKAAKSHTGAKGNQVASDSILKARQSKMKQERGPIVINLDSYNQKKSTSRTAHSKKMLLRFDNDIVKHSNGDRGIIKSPTGWLTDGIIDAAQKNLQKQFGIAGFQSVARGQCCNFNVEPDEFIHILHHGRDHWVTIGTIGTNTLRCLCMIACTLICQTCSNNRLPPSSKQKMMPSPEVY